MFARMVVTGLILDPDRSVSDFLFSSTGIIPSIQRRLTRAQSEFQRNTSIVDNNRAAWRLRSAVPRAPSKRNTAIFTEAPFQKAVAKQQSISAAGRPFFRHSWHRIDLIAVVSFWITFILATSHQETTATHHIYIFRALSVLRAGRLLVITSGTTTILHSLKRAGPLLITVAYYLIFAGCLFSIIGVQSFRGSFRRECVLTDPNNSSNIIDLSQTCGGYLDPVTFEVQPYLTLQGTPAKIGPKGYTCPSGQICQVGNYPLWRRAVH